MKKTFREKINQDNGKYFQVGNKNLSPLEIVGYFLVIASFIVFALVSKAGFQHAWLGWCFIIIGVILAFIGDTQDESE